MPWNELITVFAATAGIALGAVLLLWLLSIPLRDVSIIDMAFAAIIAALVIAAVRCAAGRQWAVGRAWVADIPT